MLITCYKRTEILLYRRNLNKGKILDPYEEDNTDKKRGCVIRRRRNGVITIDRNDRLYRRESHCANSAAGPISFIFFNVCG